MPVSAEAVNDDLKELRTEVHALAISVSSLASEYKIALGIGKWAGGLLVGTVITYGTIGVFWSGSISSRIATIETQAIAQAKDQESRAEERAKRLEMMLAASERLEREKADAIFRRLDLIEQNLARLFPPPREQKGPAEE